VLARRGKLIGYGSIGKKYFAQAEGGELIETFLNREIEVTPECCKSADDTVRQHDDERGNYNWCCGGGGVQAVGRAGQLRHQVFNKMDQVEKAGAKIMISLCSNCRLTMDESKARWKWEGGLSLTLANFELVHLPRGIRNIGSFSTIS